MSKKNKSIKSDDMTFEPFSYEKHNSRYYLMDLDDISKSMDKNFDKSIKNLDDYVDSILDDESDYIDLDSIVDIRGHFSVTVPIYGIPITFKTSIDEKNKNIDFSIFIFGIRIEKNSFREISPNIYEYKAKKGPTLIKTVISIDYRKKRALALLEVRVAGKVVAKKENIILASW